jgi:hypothetical protein
MAATNNAYKSARRLRKHMSLPEVLLWRLLRKASPPIRRQHPLGAYVVDFYCPAAKLIIEVDGFAQTQAIGPVGTISAIHGCASEALRFCAFRRRTCCATPSHAPTASCACARPLHHSADALRSPSPSLRDGEDLRGNRHLHPLRPAKRDGEGDH